MKIVEKCPKCGAAHTRGEYEPRGDGSKKVAPPDVVCSCGLTLRWSVPIFKITRSGYQLRVLRDDETPFIKADDDDEENGSVLTLEFP